MVGTGVGVGSLLARLPPSRRPAVCAALAGDEAVIDVDEVRSLRTDAAVLGRYHWLPSFADFALFWGLEKPEALPHGLAFLDYFAYVRKHVRPGESELGSSRVYEGFQTTHQNRKNS